MLAIRMQRTGRKGHAMFRVVVQEARLAPTSGKVVALLGSYDPHAKTSTLDAEKAKTYLKNGAQPSDRAARLLKSEGVKLPKWVKLETKKAGAIRNPEKLRKNRPAEAAAQPEEASAEANDSKPADAPKPEAEAPAASDQQPAEKPDADAEAKSTTKTES